MTFGGGEGCTESYSQIQDRYRLFEVEDDEQAREGETSVGSEGTRRDFYENDVSETLTAKETFPTKRSSIDIPNKSVKEGGDKFTKIPSPSNPHPHPKGLMRGGVGPERSGRERKRGVGNCRLGCA